jgi:aarF domain-containing kinase
VTEKTSRAKSLFKTLSGTALRAGSDALRRQFGDDKVDAFSSSAAEHLVQGLDELKGAAMKFGQMMSLMDEKTLPPGWKRALSLLQSKATPKPWSEIEVVFQKELGDKVSLFASIEPEAVRAASIGQVHRGVLLDGRNVAVKIRYPGLDESLAEDVENLRAFLKKTKFVIKGDFDSILKEMERVFHREIDFIKEAQSYREYAKLLQPWSDKFAIPDVVDECSSHGVLTTSWLEGEDFGIWMEKSRGHLPTEAIELERDRLGESFLLLLFVEFFVFRKVQSDPNPSNFVVCPDGRLGLLDFGAVTEFSSELIENYRSLMTAALQGANADLIAISQRMGFLTEDASDDARKSFLRILALAAKPLSMSAYDWGSEKLSVAVREEAVRFAVHSRFHAPPCEVVFLHRRIMGTQLALERLGAVVQARRIVDEFVLQPKKY